MRRQNQVLMAIKEKALSLGVLTNPIKIFNLLDVLGKSVKTDMGLDNMNSLISLAKDIDEDYIKKIFLIQVPKDYFMTHLLMKSTCFYQ